MFRKEYRHALEKELEGDDVRFKLVYEGPLKPEERARAEEKQKIRAYFHPQLRKLWSEHPALNHMMKSDDQGRRVDLIANDYAKGPH